MEQNIELIENKLKNSFLNIKTDMSSLKNEIEGIKADLKQIKAILDSKNFLSSTGNEGVINNHQQSTIINSDQQPPTPLKEDHFTPENIEISTLPQQPSTTINNHSQSQIVNNALNNLKKQLSETFKSLTDREFSIFISIYELEQQLDKVTYADIAKQLSLTEMTIRSYVSSLINKDLPIEKTRRFNNKVSLSIKKEFKTLNLASHLISLRNPQFNQKTLFSTY